MTTFATMLPALIAGIMRPETIVARFNANQRAAYSAIVDAIDGIPRRIAALEATMENWPPGMSDEAAWEYTHQVNKAKAAANRLFDTIQDAVNIARGMGLATEFPALPPRYRVPPGLAGPPLIGIAAVIVAAGIGTAAIVAAYRLTAQEVAKAEAIKALWETNAGILQQVAKVNLERAQQGLAPVSIPEQPSQAAISELMAGGDTSWLRSLSGVGIALIALIGVGMFMRRARAA